MRDSTVFDDGVRLTSSIQLRVPPEFRERMQAAAEREGLTLTEYSRRAIAERLARTTEPGGIPARTATKP